MLVLHHTQKPIKQVEIGIRLCGFKNNQGHVYIGHSRPDKFVFPWQYTLDIAYVLFIIEDCYVDDIANQRLYLLFSEGAFCFALVENAACGSFFCFFGFFYVDVVEAGNSFNNFSCRFCSSTIVSSGSSASKSSSFTFAIFLIGTNESSFTHFAVNSFSISSGFIPNNKI